MEGADEDCVIFDVTDHFRLFGILEKQVENPRRLREQCGLQMNPEACDSFIEKWTCFFKTLLQL